MYLSIDETDPPHNDSAHWTTVSLSLATVTTTATTTTKFIAGGHTKHSSINLPNFEIFEFPKTFSLKFFSNSLDNLNLKFILPDIKPSFTCNESNPPGRTLNCQIIMTSIVDIKVFPTFESNVY